MQSVVACLLEHVLLHGTLLRQCVAAVEALREMWAGAVLARLVVEEEAGGETQSCAQQVQHVRNAVVAEALHTVKLDR